MSESKTKTEAQQGAKGVLCPKCEHLNPRGLDKCEFCSTHLYIACPKCSARIGRVEPRCPECGNRIRLTPMQKFKHTVRKKLTRMNLLQVALLIGSVYVAWKVIVYLADSGSPE